MFKLNMFLSRYELKISGNRKQIQKLDNETGISSIQFFTYTVNSRRQKQLVKLHEDSSSERT